MLPNKPRGWQWLPVVLFGLWGLISRSTLAEGVGAAVMAVAVAWAVVAIYNNHTGGSSGGKTPGEVD